MLEIESHKGDDRRINSMVCFFFTLRGVYRSSSCLKMLTTGILSRVRSTPRVTFEII